MIDTGPSRGVNIVGSSAFSDITLGTEAALYALEPLLDRTQRNQLDQASSVVSRLRDKARDGVQFSSDTVRVATALVAVEDALNGIEQMQDILELSGTFDRELQAVESWLEHEVLPAIKLKVLQVARRVDEEEALNA